MVRLEFFIRPSLRHLLVVIKSTHTIWIIILIQAREPCLPSFSSFSLSEEKQNPLVILYRFCHAHSSKQKVNKQVHLFYTYHGKQLGETLYRYLSFQIIVYILSKTKVYFFVFFFSKHFIGLIRFSQIKFISKYICYNVTQQLRCGKNRIKTRRTNS
jgi:hypothetical protein